MSSAATTENSARSAPHPVSMTNSTADSPTRRFTIKIGIIGPLVRSFEVMPFGSVVAITCMLINKANTSEPIPPIMTQNKRQRLFIVQSDPCDGCRAYTGLAPLRKPLRGHRSEPRFVRRTLPADDPRASSLPANRLRLAVLPALQCAYPQAAGG